MSIEKGAEEKVSRKESPIETKILLLEKTISELRESAEELQQLLTAVLSSPEDAPVGATPPDPYNSPMEARLLAITGRVSDINALIRGCILRCQL